MIVKKGKYEDNNMNDNEEKKPPNVLDPHFEPPDGGWGWMIVIAAGFSNFCILPILQSFGLIFRDRFEQLGINASQTTTILNVNCAVTSCIGLINGPLFRKYSYRQVAFVGGFICGASICALSFTRSFAGILITLSILYAIGIGISMSAVALALNTYFKKRRRIATGLSWTCVGLGPIIMPQIITALMPIYGMSGTVLLYGGFAFNSVACAILLQPVSRHAKKESDSEGLKTIEQPENEKEKANGDLKTTSPKALSMENILRLDKIAHLVGDRSSQRFGSQYLYYDDEQEGAAGIDMIALGAPMMSRANDGWFSKRNASYASLASNKTLKRECSQQPTSRRPSLSLSRQPSLMALSTGNSVRSLSRQTNEADAKKRKISNHQIHSIPQLIIVKETSEDSQKDEIGDDCKKVNDDLNASEHLLTRRTSIIDKECDEEKRHVQISCFRKALNTLVIFFDLDLLRDPVYVNLMLGINFANFAELNFSLLTPFILAEYGMRKIDVAVIMSVLAGVDVVTRITIPFVATRIGWENRTFFLIGVGSIAMGRVVLAHVGSYGIIMAVTVLIGAGKALRTIFMALVIPTHVPLERLPAATGLQLVTSGLIFIILGPLVGWIRDTCGNYTVMLHCLNVLTYMTIISWSLEVWYCSRRRQRLERTKVAPI